MSIDPSHKAHYLKASNVLLLLANLIPVYGVLAWDWDVFAILLLFWLENLIIGVFNVARILTATAYHQVEKYLKIFLALFFTFHFGMFTLVHGLFIIFIFGGTDRAQGELPTIEGTLALIEQYHLSLPLLALFLSHGYSFVANFLLGGERFNAAARQLMTRPYRRVIVLHITIIVGGGLMLALNSPLPGLLVLIALKIALDLYAHQRTHKKEALAPGVRWSVGE